MAAPGAGEMGARAAALSVLQRVEAGAYAAPLVERAVAAMPRREERALCTELVYGCLRWQGELDFVLNAYLRRPLDHLPAAARVALRLGTYQLLHLTRVPAHAAVSTSVSLVQQAGLGGLSGLVNGVLRRVGREARPPLPGDEVAALAVAYSHPPWLVATWLGQYGREAAERLLAYDNEPPPVSLRVRPAVGRERLGARLAEAGIAAEATSLSPNGLRLGHGTAVPRLPGFAEGEFVVQDEAAMLAVEWLHARPGEHVVDACAGRGTKTWGLVDAVGPDGSVLAVDSHGVKLAALGREATRRGYRTRVADDAPAFGWHGLMTRALDARTLPSLLAGAPADRILLDAPCTGLGVLRRRPELRWRRSATDAVALSALQVALLTAALDGVRPGGEVLYVTCSTDEREDEAVVAAALAARPGAVALPVAPDLTAPGVAIGAAGSVRLFGPDSRSDSFFYARLRRRD